MHAAILARREDIAVLCRRFGVSRLEVFGSAARASDFDPLRSDVDVLVSFTPEQEPGMAAFLDFRAALEAVVGRPVDLVERPAVERSRNHIRRARILGEAEALYAA